jgi:hypothetical protein
MERFAHQWFKSHDYLILMVYLAKILRWKETMMICSQFAPIQ